MEFKQKKAKLSLPKHHNKDHIKEESTPSTNEQKKSIVTTPLRTNRYSEDEESPYFPCSTQEMREDVDVLWDYNSPKSRFKANRVRSHKRVNIQNSPKVILQRYPSNNNEKMKQDFCKLREELRALKAEIAKPVHEDSLILSPQDEEDYRNTVEMPEVEQFDQLNYESDFEDPFNDDMDDKLLLFSQQVEENLKKSDTINVQNNCDNEVVYNRFEINSGQRSRTKRESDVFNDSFGNMLSQNEDVFEQMTQVYEYPKYKHKDLCIDQSNKKSNVLPRCVSENVMSSDVRGKVEWHRTQSFESYTYSQITQEKLQEIEKKRLEAKAKREAKKVSDSSLRCSSEEIEKKRRQALAKLELKRQQEFIERKKQEALKRREENRKKSASQVKSSLTTRL
ncbi:hypothetical protein ABEB36_007166 [Hypothenemus hampei]|uniref:Coiled-coil domain-containing protein 86 n=1 Tax=Hypothenemus hampei TaxID=57062 RepID=A0ABD1ET54_HYPHA